jgi:DNA-binding XRE family transcriptional regulator
MSGPRRRQEVACHAHAPRRWRLNRPSKGALPHMPAPDIKRPHFYLRLRLSVRQPEGVMRMSTLANSPADELVQSEASVDVTARASSIDMFIGSRVRIRRTSRGMTQHELSELLDIERDNLAAHEAGVERINAKLLFQIAKLLDTRPDYFFRGYTTEDWKAA